MEYKHKCLKCHTDYTDHDPEPYFCESCIAERKAIAAQIDATVGNRPRKEAVSDFKQFEAEAKTYTTPDGRTVSFIKA
jgi:uncharacterized Zn ribbon protein